MALALALGLGTAAATGCPHELRPSTPERAWTVLVFMAADTDPSSPDALAPFARADLDEMQQGLAGLPSPRATVLTQIDRPGPGGYQRAVLGGASPGAGSGAGPSVVDEQVPPAQALREFLQWGVQAYPAEHYAVIVWGHGKGWRNGGTAPTQAFSLGLCGGGVAWDDHPNGVIDTPALRHALEVVREQTGRPIDVYAADACLMQTAEVLTELRDTARYLVGSEQIGSYLGLPYGELIRELAGAPSRGAPAEVCADDDEACRVAWLLPQLVADSFAPGGDALRERPDDAKTFTSSAVDGEQLDPLRDALLELGRRIDAWLKAAPIRGIDVRSLLRHCNTPDFLCGSRDLGVLLDHLRVVVSREPDQDEATRALLSAIDGTQAALDRAVIHATFGAQYDEDCRFENDCRHECHRGRRGLSVWLPRDRQEQTDRGDEYSGSPIAAWDDWLGALP